MATKKYVSFNNLSKFLDNIKSVFATKTEMDAKSDKTHTHSISDVTNLQSTLNGKASTSHGTHVTYSTTAPVMDGTASVGSASTVARSDHRHPTDTSRAAQTSLDTHTSNTTTHITSTERANWNTAYTHSQSAHAPSNAEPNQNAFSNVKIGDVTIAADIKTDTLTLVAGNNITLTPDATNDKITISAKDTTYNLGSFGITATAAELNKLDGVTATATEINYIDGVTSNIQNQLDGKAASSHTHKVANISDLTATATELNYMDGVTSNVQTQLDGKAASSHNHSASNITSGTLSSDRLPTVPIAKGGTGATTASGALTNLGITASASELNYVDGVTSNIQTQLNNKAASSHTHNYLPLSGGNLTGVLGVGNKYELSPAYNYTNGCLIDIGASKNYTMVAIHITGNSYNSSTSPINSLFQFYDYGDGTIMNCSGVNLGLKLGAMTVYRYNNRLYAYIKQTGDYQTLGFTILTNKSGLAPTVENAAAHTSGYTDLVTITPKNVSMDGHTHNYAGSSSAGGAATSAIKATQDASGNVITSTYATKVELDTAKSNLQTSINGKANSSHTHTIANVTNLQTTLDGKSNTSHNHTKLTGWSDTRTVATTPNTYNSSLIISGLKNNSAIGSPDDSTYSGVIGFRSWSDSSGGNAHELAFTGNGSLCRRHGATTSWGSWQTILDSGNYKTYCTPANIGASATGHTHSYAGSSSVGGSATSAVKLDTSTAGDANTPVYFSGGKPVACTSLDLNTSGSSASCTGNSATATKLQTARTIGLGTGATGTATSFNGTANITIPVTDVKESYLSWGGKNITGSVSPIDAACSNIHSANRFTFAKPAGITIEYSTNGSTYSTYSTTDSAKVNLVSGIGSTYYIGARSSSTTVNDKLRITLNATNMGVYTLLRKLLINISTGYSTGSNVIIEKAMKGSETTFKTVGTYNISGWSGWNSIPINAAFGGGDTQTSNIAVLRLTFGITGVNSSQTANALTIMDIIGIGDTYWSYPSTMAKTGHLYSYDSSQNATFPAKVTATTFVGALSGNATTATTASSCSGNSATATKLSSAKTISLTGDVTGSTSFDGSGNVSITATVADDSHNHIISNVDGLQSALDGKASSNHNHNSSYISKDLQMTSDTGDISISWSGKDVVAQFKALASGMYTTYSPVGNTNNPNSGEAFRFMCHKTGSANYGWIMAYGGKGSVYTGYIDNGNWQGWKALWEYAPQPLWSGGANGGYYMTATHTITPTKKLSECRNGWALLWSDYDVGDQANNTDFYVSYIYKRAYTGQVWGGGEWYCDIPSYSAGTATDSEQRVIKLLQIYDAKIVGTENNAAAPRNDVVLRAVYEF